MHEIVSVPISDLLLDTANARLGEEQPSQQAVYLHLATQQGRRLVALARDIVENGLDPTTLPAVVATGDRRRRYIVIEGNRRALALKALETPSIVGGALAPADHKALLGLSARYLVEPIDEVDCVLFQTQEDAEHWVDLRHTGANEGAGLVEWDSNELDRYRARHGGGRSRTLGGQALDFVDRIDGADMSGARIVTNLDRLMKSPAVRQAIGLNKEGSDLTSRYPAEEVIKGLRKIVGDLRASGSRSRTSTTNRIGPPTSTPWAPMTCRGRQKHSRPLPLWPTSRWASRRPRRGLNRAPSRGRSLRLGHRSSPAPAVSTPSLRALMRSTTNC